MTALAAATISFTAVFLTSSKLELTYDKTAVQWQKQQDWLGQDWTRDMAGLDRNLKKFVRSGAVWRVGTIPTLDR